MDHSVQHASAAATTHLADRIRLLSQKMSQVGYHYDQGSAREPPRSASASAALRSTALQSARLSAETVVVRLSRPI